MKIITILLLLLLFSCSKKENVQKQQPKTKQYFYFLSEVVQTKFDKNELFYKLYFENDSLKGKAYVYNHFLSKLDSFEIKGIKNKSKIKWDFYHNNIKTKYAEGRYFPESGISLQYNSAIDSIPINIRFLKSLPEHIYKHRIKFVYQYDSIFKSELGEEHFNLDTIYGKYKFNISVTNWNKQKMNSSEGNANVSIKITDTVNNVIQTINSNRAVVNNPDFIVSLNKDFNFDGINDLQLHTGYRAAYMTNSSDVYLFDKKKNKFVLNRDVEKGIGGTFYKLDQKRKWIISESKSGCCYHYTSAFKFEGNRLKLVKETIVEYKNSNTLLLEERVLKNNKWKIKKRKFLDTKKNTEKVYKYLDY